MVITSGPRTALGRLLKKTRLPNSPAPARSRNSLQEAGGVLMASVLYAIPIEL